LSRDEIDEEYQRRLKEQMKKKRTTSLKTSSVTSTGEPSVLSNSCQSINGFGLVPVWSCVLCLQHFWDALLLLWSE
jgi:hypothetical protein